MDTPTRTASASPTAARGQGRRRPGRWPRTAGPRPFPATHPRSTVPPHYGWNRILAGATLMEQRDPGWWQPHATPAVDVATMQVADAFTCPAAQRNADRRAPGAGQRRARSPFHAGLRRLGIGPAEAAAFGLAGVDADLLTPGWRWLITQLRAGVTLDELAGLA